MRYMRTIFICNHAVGVLVVDLASGFALQIFPPNFSLPNASNRTRLRASAFHEGSRTHAPFWQIKTDGEFFMGKRDEWIAKYAEDLKTKCNMTPDMDLLTKVTIGCGPAIYNKDAQTVAGGQASELETVKNNFLIKKLGLADGPELMEAIDNAVGAVDNTCRTAANCGLDTESGYLELAAHRCAVNIQKSA